MNVEGISDGLVAIRPSVSADLAAIVDGQIDATTGTWVSDGAGSEATLTGAGTYTIADGPNGTKKISASAESCVHVLDQVICRTNQLDITLTPAGN